MPNTDRQIEWFQVQRSEEVSFGVAAVVHTIYINMCTCVVYVAKGARVRENFPRARQYLFLGNHEWKRGHAFSCKIFYLLEYIHWN